MATPRLRLMPVRDGDLPALLTLFNEPEVGRYLLDGHPVSQAWVQAEIAASRDRFASSSAGLWAIREHAEDTLLGVVGYRPFFDPPELQLVYALRPSSWGRGLATEAARAALDHGFEALAFDEVRAATDAPNEASIRVLEQLGMAPWKTTPGTPWDTIFFRVRREE
ncbi:MAG: GNAT family N-acetyltransferase [Gemmatimonadetes bacterium]|nr:GNAT family N-acetyltransferase [Gemmatimonadota bacterium]